jgi:geranylgeranyl pyrophosphate synthase
MNPSYLGSSPQVAAAFASLVGAARVALDWAALMRVLAEHRLEQEELKRDASDKYFIRREVVTAQRVSDLYAESERITQHFQSLLFFGVTRFGEAWKRLLEVRVPELQRCLQDFLAEGDPPPATRNAVIEQVRVFLQESGELIADQASVVRGDIEALQSLFIEAGEMPKGVATRRAPLDDECAGIAAKRTHRSAKSARAGGDGSSRSADSSGDVIAPNDVVQALDRTEDIERVRAGIARWVQRSSPAVQPMLDHQFTGLSKFFRPLTIFGCHYAVREERVPDRLVVTAQAVEMVHNVTLIIDDLVDGSDERRSKCTLHVDYGELTAYMVAGYIMADAYDIVASRLLGDQQDLVGNSDETRARTTEHRPDQGFVFEDAVDGHKLSCLDEDGLAPEELRRALDEAGPVRFDLRLLSELIRRLCIAECIQWSNRGGAGASQAAIARGDAKRPLHVGRKEAPAKRPLGVADWRVLAREDTGCMFEICAVIGARSQRFRRFGRLLGMLYHGCDDVADVSEAERLGGGKDEDVRDRILTLPAALAIQNVRGIAELFYHDKPTEEHDAVLLAAYKSQIPAAERELDNIQSQVLLEIEALGVPRPEELRALVGSVRKLSK